VRAAVLALALAASPAGAECRQALALGLDVSGSVDEKEYALQVQGLAAALGHETVRAILLEAPEWPVWLAVYDWSGPDDMRVIQPWVAIDGADRLEAVRSRLAGTPRRAGAPQTAVGAAMMFGNGCWKTGATARHGCWTCRATASRTPGRGPGRCAHRPG